MSGARFADLSSTCLLSEFVGFFPQDAADSYLSVLNLRLLVLSVHTLRRCLLMINPRKKNFQCRVDPVAVRSTCM